jgi:hypothetical protein
MLMKMIRNKGQNGGKALDVLIFPCAFNDHTNELLVAREERAFALFKKREVELGED